MKNSVIITVLIIAFTFLSPTVSGQVKINLKKKVNKEADNRANKKTNEAVNTGFDKMEEGIKGIFKKNDDGKSKDDVATGKVDNQPGSNPGNQDTSPSLAWNKYDFVPGDKIIFEDNLIGEENGEFPSRWDLVKGTVENAQFGGENVIMFRSTQSRIVPYLKNPKIDYLPDVFTIEFDLYLYSGAITIYLFDSKNQSTPSGQTALDVTGESMALHPANSNLPDGGSIRKKWTHISVAYTSGKMKAYIDETRLINIPHLPFNPTGISLYTGWTNDKEPIYIKNFRIAEGGVKYYDRFLQDGKIVSNGIRFDVGKATLRPESMGVLNEIYKLLDEHPEVKVSIEGHTDSDGDYDLNQNLSEDRAKAVMTKLISMGIDANRVTSKGYGESKPVDSNDTPEGKASNRRVEFVKM